MQTFACEEGDKRYVICSALGHLYAISDPFRRRDVYPTFDLEWFPINQIDRTSHGVQRRIEVMRKLAANASCFINACDFDVEGETIGYNLLKYAWDGKGGTALRAKFSTLTKEELVTAISEAAEGAGAGLAKAGRVRHVSDFVWGINISRALAVSLATSGSGYRTISMGRVRGPEGILKSRGRTDGEGIASEGR